MDFYHWVGTHGLDLIQSIGIVAGFSLNVVAYRRDDQSRQVENQINLAQSHQELWREQFRDPQLKRILEPEADLDLNPMTFVEKQFVKLLVTHMNSFFYANRYGLTVNVNGAEIDVGQLFSLPIPKRVWEEVKAFQNKDFVEFVDACLHARR